MPRGQIGSDDGGGLSSIGPACPQNWYLLASGAELDAGAILTRPLGGIEVVLYRGRDSGRAVAFAAHCAHAGCHLRHGTVVGDNLRCALHHRIIAPDGRFIGKDGTPLAASPQPRLPVIERFGCIFVFAGAQPAFDLPMPDICAHGPVTARPLAPQTFPLPWSTLTSNGMDIDHLQAIHGRRLIEPATFQHIDEHRVRLSYRARVTGNHLSDRVMKWLSDDEIRTSITCVAGSMMLVDSTVGRHRTFVLMSMCPVGGALSSARAVAGVAGAPERAGARLAVAVAAWLFRAFLEKDVGVLQQMNWREPEVEITAGDPLMRALFRFFRSLRPFDPAIELPLASTAPPVSARERPLARAGGAMRARHSA